MTNVVCTSVLNQSLQCSLSLNVVIVIVTNLDKMIKFAIKIENEKYATGGINTTFM